VLDHLPLPDPEGAPWALFLDLDGTLLETAARPDAVIVPDHLPGLLERLRCLLDGRLAIVSGRPCSELAVLLHAVPCLDLCGCHGAEFRVGGSRMVLSGYDRLAAMAELLIGRVQHLRGAFVEINSHGFALHYPEGVTPEEALRIVEAAIAGEERNLRVLIGKRVVEVVPSHIGKGIAVAAFMAEARFAGAVPVFVGDDVTDEEGFREVKRRGGLAVHVGDHETCADFRARNVAEVHAWLGGPLVDSLKWRRLTDGLPLQLQSSV
jgi:trehalose 6-phosphate phosphatase